MNLETTDYKLVYENYKEPLKEVPKGEGFGYYGTLAMTQDGELVQCHICGKLFTHVGQHIREHKVKVDEYKEQFGLSRRTSLICNTLREHLQQLAIKRKTPEHILERNKKVKSGEITLTKAFNGMRLEARNKRGLCADQVLDKIIELKKKLGHAPSVAEFKSEYKSRYLSSMNYHYGGYNNAVIAANLIPYEHSLYYTDDELLQKLVEFKKKYKRIPMTSDMDRGFLPSRKTYDKRFGGINYARVAAGQEAVVGMGFGQFKLLSPDEFYAYKGGSNGKV